MNDKNLNLENINYDDLSNDFISGLQALSDAQ